MSAPQQGQSAAPDWPCPSSPPPSASSGRAGEHGQGLGGPQPLRQYPVVAAIRPKESLERRASLATDGPWPQLLCSSPPPAQPPMRPPLLTTQELLSSQTVCDLVATVTNLDEPWT